VETNDQPAKPLCGDEPFNLSPSEILDAWGQPQPPATEAETSKCFERIVGPTFDLVPQVWLRAPCGQRLRIDYVGAEKGGKWPSLFGFELKNGSREAENFTEFSTALAQAQDYSQCRIESDIFGRSEWFSKYLRHVFLFPCPYVVYEQDNHRYRLSAADFWAQGAGKLAAKSGVGVMSYIPRRRDWGMFLAGHPAYWLKTGVTHLGQRHAVGERLASAR
jgi:hypothetical protein